MPSVLKDYAMDAVLAVTFRRDFNYIEKCDVLKMYDILETVADYMAIVSPSPLCTHFALRGTVLTWLAYNSLEKSPGFINFSWAGHL